MSNYLRVNSRCLQIAKKLAGSWTPSRVAKTIWTAARFLAANGEDLAMSLPKRKKKEGKRKARGANEAEDDDDDDADDDDDDDDEERGVVDA